jgi:hypothetical protein
MPVANLFFENFKSDFITNYNLLKDFHFTFDNPVFWIFIFLLFFVLLEIWDLRNAFSFTAIVTTVLLLTTKAENYLTVLFSRPGETFDAFLMRVMAIVFISFLFFLYIFIRR